MGNPAIEELFLVLNRNRAPGTRIHIYPCRFGEEENEKILSYSPVSDLSWASSGTACEHRP